MRLNWLIWIIVGGVIIYLLFRFKPSALAPSAPSETPTPTPPSIPPTSITLAPVYTSKTSTSIYPTISPNITVYTAPTNYPPQETQPTQPTQPTPTPAGTGISGKLLSAERKTLYSI